MEAPQATCGPRRLIGRRGGILAIENLLLAIGDLPLFLAILTEWGGCFPRGPDVND
jgi:hypothetical protein